MAASLMEQNKPPRVWVLTGPRAGDNAQVIGLAEALGWPFEEKFLSYFAVRSKRSNRLIGASLSSVKAGSDVLMPPWPDLVLGVGRRSVSVARWIKEQSGGKTRLVHLNRPRAPLSWFDLVIATPQYRMQPAPNLRRIARPFHRVNKARLEEARARWEPLFKDLPRPWIAVLGGGDAPPFRFSPQAAAKLAEFAVSAARQSGGSLLVTSSFRMSKNAEDRLMETIEQAPHHAFRWKRDAEDNPYFGYLALADRFIVTGESISMLCEAAQTGKPVTMFPVPWVASSPAGRLERIYHIPGVKQLLDKLDAAGWVALPRDTRSMQDGLLAQGVVTLPEDTPHPPTPTSEREIKAVLREIKELMARSG